MLSEIINLPGRQIIDVREPSEFNMGYAEGAINIPLSKIVKYMPFFREQKGPFILYCRSGIRSGQAMEFLKSQNIQNVYNAGGLENVVTTLYYSNMALENKA